MSAPTFITGRGAINPWECDQWGHLNVQFYLARPAMRRPIWPPAWA